MSLIINGTTNTLTAASGLTIAGNTAVTGTLSATGVASVTDTTDATSTTAASLKTAGGIAAVKSVIAGKGFKASGPFAIGASEVGVLSYEAPVTREYIGDGTGYSRVFSKRAASVTTDLWTLADATGNVTMTGNLVMASGKGIDFSATSNGSGTTTSEVLSDYEEGTWTPNVGGTATYTTQDGRYTKVGRKVTASFDLIINVLGTGSTSLLSGLPFTGVAQYAPLSVGYFQSLAISPVFLTGYGASGSTAIQMAGLTAGATSISNLAVFGNAARVIGSITYFV